ncbi:hypothetical protein BGX38DRAFT_722165 [Terfezia claveryi]|nr:hypothetical protein BGX38DRAFT_722165 [Terfezia claveryi]
MLSQSPDWIANPLLSENIFLQPKLGDDLQCKFLPKKTPSKESRNLHIDASDLIQSNVSLILLLYLLDCENKSRSASPYTIYRTPLVFERIIPESLYFIVIPDARLLFILESNACVASFSGRSWDLLIYRILYLQIQIQKHGLIRESALNFYQLQDYWDGCSLLPKSLIPIRNRG